MSTRNCLTEGCLRTIGERSKSDLCAHCRAGLRYWDERSHADVIQRREQLTMLHSRLAHLASKRKPARSSVSVRRRASAHEARAS